MVTLGELPCGSKAKVVSVDGGRRFLSRVAAMGIVPGSIVEMVSNQKRYPFLIFGRGTMVAINRSEGEKIKVERIRVEGR
ncbi:MAG: ferrous iron transport protein A [Puniceicoccales bacterium]|jgi:ferrous iron transport protein A|nr:ferrous iron transport protein A [Puniceicoccales bacterium]